MTILDSIRSVFGAPTIADHYPADAIDATPTVALARSAAGDLLTPSPEPVRHALATAPGSAEAQARNAARPVKGETQLSPMGRAYRKTFAGITAGGVAAELKRIMTGSTQQWADFCSHMARSDEKLRSLIESMILGITSAELTIEPADDSPEAVKAAEILQAAADEPGFADRLSGLLYAEHLGWGAAEHDWQRVGGVWLSSLRQVAPRDVRFASDWTPEIRVWSSDPPPPDITPVELGSDHYWVSVAASSPNRWVVHTPEGLGEPPTLAGDLHTVAWIWFFKHWADVWHQTSLERFANPFIWGKYQPNTAQGAMDALYEGLQNLSGDQVAAFEAMPDGSDPINVLDASGSQKGSPHVEAIHTYDERLAVAITGSTLAFGGGETSGNRALAEQQVKSTVIPRLQAHALRLVSTLREQWAMPHLRLNTSLTGGRVAPMPVMRFELTQEERPVITADVIDTGAASMDDVRRGAGLVPWGGAEGDAIAVRKPPAGAPAP